jgi:hypothetical protein
MNIQKKGAAAATTAPGITPSQKDSKENYYIIVLTPQIIASDGMRAARSAPS